MFISLICLSFLFSFFFFNDTATTEIYTLSLHDALPIYGYFIGSNVAEDPKILRLETESKDTDIRLSAEGSRSEEHTSELQSHHDLVCRLLLEKKKKKKKKKKIKKKKKLHTK